MDYITAKEASEKWGLTTRRVQILCQKDKIKGVTRLGKVWAIPVDAEKPRDGRMTKYHSDINNKIHDK